LGKVNNSFISTSLLIFIGSLFFMQFCEEKKDGENESDLEFFEKGEGILAKKETREYVGSEICRDCHFAIYESHKLTAKGRAFHLPEENDSLVDFSNIHVYDSYSDYHYTGFWDDQYFHVREYRLKGPDTVHSLTKRVDFVIGSGNRARSFLYQKNGYIFEIPISWYVNKGIWDLSPGYENGANSRFDRAMGQQCISCHNTGFELKANSLNLFHNIGLDGIGCEKCHGPGGKHVVAMDSSFGQKVEEMMIVNPAKLPLSLQFDVCRQCHLNGITVDKAGKNFVDFRPGDPLEEFLEVFIPISDKSNDFGFASHTERLQMSDCFLQSDGKMNCVSCHDPHKPLPGDKALFYQQKCLKCHKMDDCGEEKFIREKQGDNCASCHMPKGGPTDIPHVSFTDHQIRIVKMSSKPMAGVQTDNPSENKKAEQHAFATFSSSNADFRDRMIVNLEYYEKFAQDPGYLARVAEFIDSVEVKSQLKYYYLDKASKPDPGLYTLGASEIEDAYSAFYIAEIRKRNRLSSHSYYKRARDLATDNIDFNYRLGKEYLDMDKVEEAKIYFEEVLSRIPWHKEALVNYGFILQGEGDFKGALNITQRAIYYDPDYLRARENKVDILLKLGQKAAAKAELDILIEKDPENRNYLIRRAGLLEAG
jgi:tetratricopeptide (TPR) repeat protein